MRGGFHSGPPRLQVQGREFKVKGLATNSELETRNFGLGDEKGKLNFIRARAGVRLLRGRVRRVAGRGLAAQAGAALARER